jgi:hypothetical protein
MGVRDPRCLTNRWATGFEGIVKAVALATITATTNTDGQLAQRARKYSGASTDVISATGGLDKRWKFADSCDALPKAAFGFRISKTRGDNPGSFPLGLRTWVLRAALVVHWEPLLSDKTERYPGPSPVPVTLSINAPDSTPNSARDWSSALYTPSAKKREKKSNEKLRSAIFGIKTPGPGLVSKTGPCLKGSEGLPHARAVQS